MSIAYTLASVAGVTLVSLVGAIGLAWRGIGRHGVMMFLIALAAGTLIGDSFLHLLPEASHHGFTTSVGLSVLGGFLALFLLEVVLRIRHDHADKTDAHHGHEAAIEPFGILNLVADAIHNFLDGVVIAAAYLVDVSLGLATTLAVLLHEVPQELGDFAILVRSGLSPAKALLMNLGSAVFAFAGAAIVLLVDVSEETLTEVALPIVAGAFIYIAAADLIPELHHHNKGRDKAVVLFGFVLGLALMWALLALEPAAAHA